MSSPGIKRFPTNHGHAELRPSRYLVLYLTQLCWLVLGAYLYSRAFWPSTCTPESLLEVYSCSMRLPESGGWVEASLLTWLWATPILILLEVSRRMSAGKE